ncbi:AAA family ATPase [Bacillus sp. B1-b2]|uniref:AAA family ATPase n=1 Tax=Bacillus sp. B1-b2 TaxID=2653201 RepID=UPI00126287A4|nr:AAA family ATPase [Bacillus sp. B1-b2]KAB7668386.1 ATP-binding protein [Bacillus sp. B1-b2]
MDRVLILLAGFPGTGKSFLGSIIKKKLGILTVISPDEIKEDFFDYYGFRNLDEKEELINLAWEKFYDVLESQMVMGNNVILDYPFSDKQKPSISRMSEMYHYQVITIRLIADLDVLFERQKNRDLDTSRHLSHIVKSYKKGDNLEHRKDADNLLTYEEFMRRCTTRGYDTFELGVLFEVDVTDYATVDYASLLNEVSMSIGDRG